MRKLFCIPALLLAGLHVTAQKKPITHSVYDGWQNINERYISNNGKWVVYTITPQEGDATLIIQSTDKLTKKKYPAGIRASYYRRQPFCDFQDTSAFSKPPAMPGSKRKNPMICQRTVWPLWN